MNADTSSPEPWAGTLAASELSDERFYEATDQLSRRFDRRSPDGDPRTDDSAPGVLHDWFRHAEQRVPDFRVWRLGCRIMDYFDPEFGLYLPWDWPASTREAVLEKNRALRARPPWEAAVRSAMEAPDARSIEALSCCAAKHFGIDPYPMLRSRLTKLPDDPEAWFGILANLNDERLEEFLAHVRADLVPLVLALDPQPEPDDPAFDEHDEKRWPAVALWALLRTIERSFPGRGLPALECALQSRDWGLQLLALDMLTWHRRDRPLASTTVALVRDLHTATDRALVRERCEHLLEEAGAEAECY